MPIRHHGPNQIIFCACGCGETLLRYDKYGRERKYIHTHHVCVTSLAEKLLINIDIKGENECWPWKGAKSSAGYGQIRHKGKLLYIHRCIYMFYHGPISKGKVILHRCDNPICCNPFHLREGSQLDNVHDAHKKGRINGTSLTNQNVIDIRSMAKEGISQKQVANEFNVHPSYISRLCNYERRGNVSCL